MSRFDWITPMRKGVAGTDEDRAARAEDGLAGQAAATVLRDGRVQLVVMPDAGTFDSSVTISADDALALAKTILDRVQAAPVVAGDDTPGGEPA
jgi:hypothetical protein